jgi:DNA mismatch endonuclease, patch repair protein
MNPSRKGVPEASSPAARKRMRATRQRDTAAEMAVRSLLHAAGLRYRVDAAPVAGVRRRADIVFPSQKVAVYIDGCFWHACPQHGTMPKSNKSFWQEKLRSNQARDQDTNERLQAAGWVVLRFWEHEDPTNVAQEIQALLP